ncbi:hypothetical protein VTK73DRAFT_3734 [Phialemonium thermophilum]|uniref:Transcription factor domain-containing protein n=1 Tax=Phialemonium thermophilum TaxID=223376 RepID=A0ABR3Y116_9PEZI
MPSPLPALLSADASCGKVGSRQLSNNRRPLGGDASRTLDLGFQSGWASGPVVKWSGVDIQTQFPRVELPSNPWVCPWTSAPGSLAPTGLPACNSSCTLHSSALHDAFRLLQETRAFPRHFTDTEWHPERVEEVLCWLMALDPTPSYVPRSLGSAVQQLSQLPITPTEQNATLLRIYVKLVCRFKASLDGNPDPSNVYNNIFVPYSLQTPVLAQVAIYTAACFLTETGNLTETTTMAHKGQAIRLLNDHLRSEFPSSDEAIAAVIQLIVNEWYWGDTTDLRAHLRGLHEMVRLRGGFQNLGLEGLISKLAITADTCIALSYETPPFLPQWVEFEPPGDVGQPPRPELNTPLVPYLPSFQDCSDELNLHATTASILEDMRFLISAVLALSAKPTSKELQKIRTTSGWIHAKISKIATHLPVARHTTSIGEQERVDAEGPSCDESNATSAGGDIGHSSRKSALSAKDRCESGASRQKEHRVGGSDDGNIKSESTQPHAHFIHQTIRLAALIYSRAIAERRPFSSVVGQADFLQLWSTMWRVPLSTWKEFIGIFNWAILPVTPTASSTAHGRFVKSMLTISVLQMGLENWELMGSAVQAGLCLQNWLGEVHE